MCAPNVDEAYIPIVDNITVVYVGDTVTTNVERLLLRLITAAAVLAPPLNARGVLILLVIVPRKRKWWN
jgi:hypothetical protein